MPPVNPVKSAQGRVAYASRRDQPPEALRSAKEELAAAKLERYIRDAMASATPLTDEQRDRLAALLRPRPTGPQS